MMVFIQNTEQPLLALSEILSARKAPPVLSQEPALDLPDFDCRQHQAAKFSARPFFLY